MILSLEALKYLFMLYDAELHGNVGDWGFESKFYHFELADAGLIKHYWSCPFGDPGEAYIKEEGIKVVEDLLNIVGVNLHDPN